jgi:hypothetical protein
MHVALSSAGMLSGFIVAYGLLAETDGWLDLAASCDHRGHKRYIAVCHPRAPRFSRRTRLKAFAPTQSEPPFLIAQAVALVLFIALGIRASNRFNRNQIRAKIGRNAG